MMEQWEKNFIKLMPQFERYAMKCLTDTRFKPKDFVNQVYLDLKSNNWLHEDQKKDIILLKPCVIRYIKWAILNDKRKFKRELNASTIEFKETSNHPSDTNNSIDVIADYLNIHSIQHHTIDYNKYIQVLEAHKDPKAIALVKLKMSGWSKQDILKEGNYTEAEYKRSFEKIRWWLKRRGTPPISKNEVSIFSLDNQKNSKTNRTILNLYKKGFTQTQISKQLGKTRGAICYQVKQLKLKNLL